MGSCPKIPYPNRPTAKRAARNVGGQTPYLCRYCGQWHLSRKSSRQVKQLRKKWGDA